MSAVLSSMKSFVTRGWLVLTAAALLSPAAAAQSPGVPASHTPTEQAPAGQAPAGGNRAALENPLPAQELAKRLANPLADMVSIPFQFNWVNGVGPDQGLRHVINIQPVVPFSISDDWNIIGRWVMPYVSQPASLGSATGFGDIVASAFLSPKHVRGVMWGVGPVVNLPTNTDPALGSGQWSAGPTSVVVHQRGAMTYGMLWNQLWSYADTSAGSRTRASESLFQPVVAYSSPSGVTLMIMSEAKANWAASSGGRWTVPVNISIGKITRFGPFPMSIQGGGGVYIVSPENGPEWNLRTVFTLILPKGR